MIRACLFILAGGFAAQHSRVPLSSDLCKLLLVASLLMLINRRARYAGCAVLGFLLFLLAGQAVVDDRLDEQFAGDSLLTRVRVLDFPRVGSDSVVMLVEPISDKRLPARSRVSWYQPAERPEIGDVWQLELRLKRPRSFSNPGVSDGEAWMFHNRIHATGYVVQGKRNRLVRTGTESCIDRFRRRFVSRARQVVASPQTSAVIAAVGVGSRQQISREQWQRYAMSGTSHLMAISGLHIGLAATAAFFLVRAGTCATRPAGNGYIGAILGGAIVGLAYAAVSGFGVPAQRASIMLLLAAHAVVCRRSIDPLRIVAIAAMTVFLLSPVATMSAGFLLSFSAVLLLFWLAQQTRRLAPPGQTLARAGKWLCQLYAVQVSLLFGLMPLTVLLFDRIAPLATPVNLVAVPLFSVLTVPAVLVGLASGDFLGQTGALALRLAARTIDWLEHIITMALHLPFADVAVAALHGHGRLLAMLPALLVLLPKGWPGRYVGMLAVGALLLHAPTSPREGCADLHVLDVGQGLSAVLQTHTRTLLFDSGAAYRSGASAAERVVVPFLRASGIRRIDWFIVSHADIDHSGGVSAVMDYAEVRELLVGEPLRSTGRASSPCLAGRSWESDGVRFRILHPTPGGVWQGNDASCVVLIELGLHAFLLTGDIETPAEYTIMRSGLLKRADVVVVPHHGSLTSSSAPFVSATAPDIAIVSAGHNNRWGFPKPLVVKRWEATGASLYNTATAGAVSVRLCGDGGIEWLRQNRRERRRFWRDAEN